MKTLLNKRLPQITAVFVFALCSTISLQAQSDKEFVIGELPSYKVSRAKSHIIVDGKMDEATWKDAEVRSLDYFFRRDTVADEQQSTFRMLWDDENLYLFYEFEDTSLTARETEYDGRPYLDDCAEFFVVPIPDSVYMHYGFEVNLIKSKYDYIVLWQFNNSRSVFIPHYNPEYEVGVTYDGTINNDEDIDKGWTMEFVIPLQVFRGFPTRNLTGKKWAFQVVRQDRNLVDDRFRSTATLFPTYDVQLDVHPPYRFGLMEFTDN